MKHYLKTFVTRGALFAGLGPIVAGIVYLILSHSLDSFSLTGAEVCLAIISTYLLAFIQAGASVFNQIEEWSVPKSMLCHLGLLYLAYVLCYLVNSWLPFEPLVILIFTAIFVGVYLAIWLTVYISVKLTSKRLTKEISQ